MIEIEIQNVEVMVLYFSDIIKKERRLIIGSTFDSIMCFIDSL